MNTTLIRLGFSIFVLLILILTLSCSGIKTEIIGQWQEDDYQKGEIDKVLVLGIVDVKKPLLRRKFEDGMKNAFIDNGLEAIASMDIMPYDEVVDSTSFEKHFKDLEFDAVLVSRLVGIDHERKVEAGYAYVIPFNSYYGFYGHYHAAIQYANSSSYLSKNVVVVLETNLYETKDKKLIWSGISETLDPDKASDVINSFSKILVSNLDQEGFFK
ncbi:MAG: hypothetical protein DRQ13_10660 [Ignavibacteriae bacterium]|nr:MAG: hypothetical protein DRQ13_10660 [Ignavibacteriota bacterium]